MVPHLKLTEYSTELKFKKSFNNNRWLAIVKTYVCYIEMIRANLVMSINLKMFEAWYIISFNSDEPLINLVWPLVFLFVWLWLSDCNNRHSTTSFSLYEIIPKCILNLTIPQYFFLSFLFLTYEKLIPGFFLVLWHDSKLPTEGVWLEGPYLS